MQRTQSLSVVMMYTKTVIDTLMSTLLFKYNIIEAVRTHFDAGHFLQWKGKGFEIINLVLLLSLSIIAMFYLYAVKYKYGADLPSLSFGNNLGAT